MSKRFLSALLALVLVIGAVGMLAGCAPAQPAKPAESTTTAPAQSAVDRAAWVMTVDEVAKDAAMSIIIDARDPKAYAAGHVPGAINAPWQTFSGVAAGKPGDKDWGILLPAADIASALGKLGVDQKKMIVVYADPTGWGEDGRVLWTLRSIGLDNSMIMSGGYPAWVAAGKETAKDAVTLSPTTVTVAKDALADINVTTDEVKKAVEGKTAKIIDARSEKEYTGATDFGEKRGGKIPGAVNIPFPTLFNEDGTVKSDADLEKLFTDAGVAKGDEIIVYCTKGIRSGHMTMLLRMLGYEKAKNYDASFYSWAGDSTLPIEK